LNPLRPIFLPFHKRLARRDAIAYQHAHRLWMIDHALAAAGIDVDETKQQTLIEIGCGDGWLAGQLSPRFARIVGFDINAARVRPAQAKNVLIIVGDAESSPIATGSADVIISIAVLEHLREPERELRHMAALLKPGGVMVHIVPTSFWKTLQWLGFIPDKFRKELRNAVRSLAGERGRRSGGRDGGSGGNSGGGKYFEGRETNNPKRQSRRKWWQKLYPRVHGEYDSNWAEFRGWRREAWRRRVRDAGLTLTHEVPLGSASPYFFGFSLPCGRFKWTGLNTVVALVVTNETKAS
jgi:SAM-dependent methyltransferase